MVAWTTLTTALFLHPSSAFRVGTQVAVSHEHTLIPTNRRMNIGFGGASALVFLLPVVVWLVALYLLIRFLRAFERGVDAHERIADALARQLTAPRSRPDERAT